MSKYKLLTRAVKQAPTHGVALGHYLASPFFRELLRAPSIIAGAPNKQWSGETALQQFFFRKKIFPETFRKTSFRNFSGRTFFRKKNLCLLEVLTNNFRKNVIRNVFGRSFFRKISIFFRKLVFFLKYFIL